MTLPIASNWIKVNVHSIGFYRVNYDEANWRSLIHLLMTSHEKLSADDRAGLLDDAFALARWVTFRDSQIFHLPGFAKFAHAIYKFHENFQRIFWKFLERSKRFRKKQVDMSCRGVKVESMSCREVEKLVNCHWENLEKFLNFRNISI